MSKERKREILGVSSVSYKFQITVPKKVRERLKIEANDSAAFIEEDGRIYLTKSTEV
jgi:AbrB family looped-hinge helix DNA binding protein